MRRKAACELDGEEKEEEKKGKKDSGVGKSTIPWKNTSGYLRDKVPLQTKCCDPPPLFLSLSWRTTTSPWTEIYSYEIRRVVSFQANWNAFPARAAALLKAYNAGMLREKRSLLLPRAFHGEKRLNKLSFYCSKFWKHTLRETEPRSCRMMRGRISIWRENKSLTNENKCHWHI